MRKHIGSALFLTVVWLITAGCTKTQDSQTAQNVPPPPADGNLAPVGAQQPLDAQSPPPAPAAPGYPSTDYSAADYPAVADNEPPVYAPEPPPPLPEYSQPPCPGPDYIWNPGYWNYADTGYYWVPGAWVLAPYIGALWTPPWWGFYGGRYLWHPGYWGPHIGFYGGIDYGFGYTGHGYYGGYWNGNTFAYNRTVTNVNVNAVHSVYEHRVGAGESSRASYNGGPRGINARPLPAEVAAVRETHTRPVAAQVEHARQASSDRTQFASENRGRPTQIARAQPLATTYRAPASRPEPAQQVRPTARPEAPFARPEPNRPAEARAEQRPTAPQRPAPQAAARPVPEPRPQAAPERQPERPSPQARPEPTARPTPQARPERPAPQARPQPAQRAAPERPAPQARPEPARRPQPVARPAPESRPAPTPERKPEEKEHR